MTITTEMKGSSYKFTFADCDFSEGFKLDTNIRRWEYVYDESGEEIEWTWWEYQDNDGYWQHVVESEIPEGVEANGPFTGYNTTPVEFNNYYVTFAFSNCKIGGNILTHTSNFINNAWCPDGIYIYQGSRLMVTLSKQFGMRRIKDTISLRYNTPLH